MTLRTALVAAANAIADALEHRASESSDWSDITDDAANPAGYRQIHAAAERGEIEVHRVGRRRLVRRAELDAWIASRPKLGEADTVQQNESSHVAQLVKRAGWRRSA